MRKLTSLVALLLLAPAITHAKNLDEVLAERGITANKGEAKAAGSEMAKTYYNSGTRFEFPDTGFTTKLNTLIQTRYQFTDNEDGASDVSGFDIDRARIGVSGTALHNEFSYFIEGEFGGETAALTDAYITWQACDNVWARMGQWRTPLSRQFNTLESKQQFVDLSSATNTFALGRNQGLTLGTSMMDGQLTAQAGIWNGVSTGEGINQGPADNDHAYHVGVRYNPMGSMDVYEEGDVNWTEDAAVSIGAAYVNAANTTDSSGLTAVQSDIDTISADVNLKYQGLSVHGEYYWRGTDTDGASDKVNATGFYVQAGYFVMPKKLEIAARYGMVDPDNKALFDTENQATAGVNYYFWGHQLKASFNYDYLQQKDVGGGSDDQSTDRWILGVSGWF